MNLKYYLRGLGLGLIVTALVLGIHHARADKASMSDSEVRARAAELGMVDGSSRLVEDDIQSTEQMLADIQDNDVTDVTSDAANPESSDDTSGAADQDIDNADDAEKPEASEDADDVIADAAALIEDTTAEITTDAYDDPVLDYPTEDDTTTVNTTTTAADDDDDSQDSSGDTQTQTTTTTSATASTSGGGTITVSSGDSSDRVARKLADAGIVSDAAAYDRFLCANGYDRKIATGTYSFTAGMSDEEIARKITGR